MTASISPLVLLGGAGAVFVSLRGIRLTRRDLPVPAMSGLAAVILSSVAHTLELSELAAWFGAALFAYVVVLEMSLNAAREPRSAAARRFAACGLTLGAALASAALQPAGIFGAAASWIMVMFAAAAAAASPYTSERSVQLQHAVFKPPAPSRRTRR